MNDEDDPETAWEYVCEQCGAQHTEEEKVFKCVECDTHMCEDCFHKCENCCHDNV